MHGVNRFENRLGRHAASVDAERSVLGVVAHKEENARAVLRGNTGSSESSRAAAKDDYRFRFSSHSLLTLQPLEPAQEATPLQVVLSRSWP
jgi:hypothetical protein